MPEYKPDYTDSSFKLAKHLLETFFTQTCLSVDNVKYSLHIEYHIWMAAMERNPQAMEEWNIQERDVQLLKTLHEALGGWLKADIAVNGDVTFNLVSTPLWINNYATWGLVL